jgi:hypothetical protein
MLLLAATSLLAMTASPAASLPTALAAGKPTDAKATSSYLRAANAFFGTAIANLHRGALAVEALQRQVTRECPAVASGAAEHVAGPSMVNIQTEVRNEAEEAVLLALIGPDLAAYRAFGSRLARLHWRNHRLTVLVHGFGQAEDEIGMIRAPQLCGDLKEWVASGYAKLPAGTPRFLEQFAVAHGGSRAQEQIERMLRPYEGARARSLDTRVKRAREQLARVLLAGLVPMARKLRTELALPAPH